MMVVMLVVVDVQIYILESSIPCDIMMCSLLKVNQHFGGTCYPIARALLCACITLVLLSDPETGSDVFHQNISKLSLDYMTRYQGRKNSP
jgi:hypothetical protein